MKSIWIARNLDGTLELFSSFPVRKKFCFEVSDCSDWLNYLDDDMYPDVTWENSPKMLFIK